MRRSALVGATLCSVLLLGCGEKEAPSSPAQSQGATTSKSARDAAGTTKPASSPASQTGSASQGASAGDARAVRQPEAVAPQLPSSVVAPTSATTTKGATAKGSLLKESELKERPFSDAATLATLAAQSKVTISERSSGWYRVESGGKQGWVRMLNVKVSEGAESLGASSDLQQAAALATGRAGSGNVVSTSGLRGLDEEKLSAAKPDYAQLEKLDGFGVSKEAASSYARQNGLKGRSVAYLPAPK